MPAPIRLTDRQLAVIMAAAEPLPVADRDPFLRDIAARLQGNEIGDGLIHRVIAEVQHRYWHSPQLDGTVDVRPVRRKGGYVKSWPS
jgi:hypothetical protein